MHHVKYNGNISKIFLRIVEHINKYGRFRESHLKMVSVFHNPIGIAIRINSELAIPNR
jgi:hypothetical protein